jgi:hypothetical protein
MNKINRLLLIGAIVIAVSRVVPSHQQHLGVIAESDYCKKAKFLGTIAISNEDSNFVNNSDVYWVALQRKAEKEFGKGVSVTNVRYDIEKTTFFFILHNTVIKGVVADVINCNSDSEK